MAVVMAVRERGAVGWWPHTLQAARAGAWAGSGLGGGSVVVCVWWGKVHVGVCPARVVAPR